jgi:hypothetical protein
MVRPPKIGVILERDVGARGELAVEAHSGREVDVAETSEADIDDGIDDEVPLRIAGTPSVANLFFLNERPRRNAAPNPVLSNRLKVAYWRPWRDDLRSGNDRVGVDAVVAIEVGNGAGLAEMLDAERPHPMAADRAEPSKRRRMAQCWPHLRLLTRPPIQRLAALDQVHDESSAGRIRKVAFRVAQFAQDIIDEPRHRIGELRHETADRAGSEWLSIQADDFRIGVSTAPMARCA